MHHRQRSFLIRHHREPQRRSLLLQEKHRGAERWHAFRFSELMSEACTTAHAPILEAPPAAQKNRLVYLDALRGLMLTVMAVNHVPSELHTVTDHPFGYMSAAEGFVFLSGLMAGLVYTKRYLKAGAEALQDGCAKRAGQIYLPPDHLF